MVDVRERRRVGFGRERDDVEPREEGSVGEVLSVEVPRGARLLVGLSAGERVRGGQRSRGSFNPVERPDPRRCGVYGSDDQASFLAP